MVRYLIQAVGLGKANAILAETLIQVAMEKAHLRFSVIDQDNHSSR